MPALGRREFLGSALSSGALLGSGIVEAADAPIRSRVERVRRRWAEGEREAEDLLFVDHLETEYPGARSELRSLARGLGAFAVVRELLELEPEDQAHPEVQLALRQALQAVGELGTQGADIVERYPFDPAAWAGSEQELHLAIHAMRADVEHWQASVDHQRMVDAALHELAGDPRPGQLRARVARRLRRARRTLELGRAVASDPAQTGLMAPDDPRLRRAAARGAERWAHVAAPAATHAADPPEGRYRPEPLTAQQWAAVIALGMVFVGGLVLGGWALCGVVCGEMTLLPLALLGLAICGLAVWGLMRAHPSHGTHKEQHAHLARLELQTAAELCPQAPESVRVHLRPRPLLARALSRHRGPELVLRAAPEPRRLVILASGLLRLDGQGPLNANGRAASAGAGAPLPDAPEGALVVQTDSVWRFGGTVATVVLAAGKDLVVDLNLSPTARTRLRGRLWVTTALYQLSGPGLESADLPADLHYAWSSR